MITPALAMWSLILEWCADAFGVTKRSGWFPFWMTIAATCFVSIMFGARWGLVAGLMPIAAVLIVGPYIARGAVQAGEELFCAACLELDDPRQRPTLIQSGRPLLAPTSLSLAHLALAVDFARRGQLVEAGELVPLVDRALLRPEEARLLDAVRALISLGLGDGRRAAQQAVLALPSGSEPLDVTLGRALLKDAWSDETRLSAIDAAWEREGIGLDHEGPLPRLRALLRVRSVGGDVSAIGPAKARGLAEEAEAIGDEELAADLIAHSRTGSYRG